MQGSDTHDFTVAIEMEILHERESQPRERIKTEHPRQDYFIGVCLLLVVVLLWTLSNFVTQDLYESGYDKPFFVTYTNTSAFSLYLIPLLIRRCWTKGLSNRPSEPGITAEYQPLHTEDEPEAPLSQQQVSPPLSVRQTANLALAFCLLWFVANWSLNASLGYTSVASATVLSSMSGFFTLGIGWLFKVEKFTLLKVAAVCTSFTGVVLVSVSDSTSKGLAGQTARPGVVQSTIVDTRATFGDVLALISALFYALYVILLKVKIKSESRVDMQLFFGFVGLLNLVACWPIGVVLHLTKFEVFELPPSRKAWQAIIINMAITWSSDFLYVLAMLKTTPLVATIGLSLTIPVAVVGDFIRLHPVHVQVIVGAILVLTSFVGIGAESSKNEKRQIETPVT